MILSNFPTGDAQGKTYGVCATDADSTEKVVELSDFKLQDGITVTVKFDNTNSATNPTMNVNGTGAYPIKKYGSTAVDAYIWQAGEVVKFVYDGTNWMMVDGATATTTNYGITKLSERTDSTSTNQAATPSAVKAAYDLANSAKIAAAAAQTTANEKADAIHTHDDIYYTEPEIDEKLSKKSDSGHKHIRSEITDFPSAMPASDVPAWAKADTKPSYTAAEVGALTVDNIKAGDGVLLTITGNNIAISAPASGPSYVFNTPVDFTLAAAGWTGKSYDLTLSGYGLCGSGLQIGLPMESSITNTTKAAQAALTIPYVHVGSDGAITVHIAAVNVPTEDITISLFGLKEVV